MSSPPRFAIHNMRTVDAERRRRSRHWDFRFVMAVLLLYGCLGVAFFAVEWMHTAPDNAPPTAQELRDWSTVRGLHPLVRPLVPEPSSSPPSEGR